MQKLSTTQPSEQSPNTKQHLAKTDENSSLPKQDCIKKANNNSIKKLRKVCHTCKKQLFTLTTSPMLLDPHPKNSTAMPEQYRNNSCKQVLGGLRVPAYPKTVTRTQGMTIERIASELLLPSCNNNSVKPTENKDQATTDKHRRPNLENIRQRGPFTKLSEARDMLSSRNHPVPPNPSDSS